MKKNSEKNDKMKNLDDNECNKEETINNNNDFRKKDKNKNGKTDKNERSDDNEISTSLNTKEYEEENKKEINENKINEMNNDNDKCDCLILNRFLGKVINFILYDTNF